jgi:hydrogenase maturation protein HypF
MWSKITAVKQIKPKIDGDPLLSAAELLKKGSIIAIKGIGGFHIAVDAMNDEAVIKLRKKELHLNPVEFAD